MNERIRELAAEAKIMTEESINMKISFSTQLKAFSEKFAELIVEKCINQCFTDDADRIARHFDIDISEEE